jgi:hypothetical protein
VQRGAEPPLRSLQTLVACAGKLSRATPAARAPHSYTAHMAEPEREAGGPFDPANDPDAAQWFVGDAFRGVLTPVLAGLMIDFADLATFGRIGTWLGMLLGVLLGWQLAPRFGLGHKPWAPALVAGIYCMTPGTALLPLATLLASVMGLGGQNVSPPPSSPAKGSRPSTAPPTIEPEYRASWDEAPPQASDSESRKDDSRV